MMRKLLTVTVFGEIKFVDNARGFDISLYSNLDLSNLFTFLIERSFYGTST